MASLIKICFFCFLLSACAFISEKKKNLFVSSSQMHTKSSLQRKTILSNTVKDAKRAISRVAYKMKWQALKSRCRGSKCLIVYKKPGEILEGREFASKIFVSLEVYGSGSFVELVGVPWIIEKESSTMACPSVVRKNFEQCIPVKFTPVGDRDISGKIEKRVIDQFLRKLK